MSVTKRLCHSLVAAAIVAEVGSKRSRLVERGNWVRHLNRKDAAGGNTGPCFADERQRTNVLYVGCQLVHFVGGGEYFSAGSDAALGIMLVVLKLFARTSCLLITVYIVLQFN